jgi:hypothetical protein
MEGSGQTEGSSVAGRGGGRGQEAPRED